MADEKTPDEQARMVEALAEFQKMSGQQGEQSSFQVQDVPAQESGTLSPPEGPNEQMDAQTVLQEGQELAAQGKASLDQPGNEPSPTMADAQRQGQALSGQGAIIENISEPSGPVDTPNVPEADRQPNNANPGLDNANETRFNNQSTTSPETFARV